jgi:hypothetical protein
MKISKVMLLPLLVGIFILIAAGIRGSSGSPNGDYLALLDRFEVTGSGAWYPGWFDDFDNGLPDDWTNMGAFGPIGTWHEEPGTSFAWLESPGDLSAPAFGVRWDRTTILSYQIGQSYVSAYRGDFQGTATFAAELPHLNQYSWLILNFDRFIDGKKYQEQIHVTIRNYAPEIASILGLSGGLQVEQKSYLLDATTWKIVKILDFRTKSITPPEIPGKVILSIRYIDDPINPRFIPCYSLTDPADFVVPFPERPIASNLHLADANPAWWSITTGIIVPIIPVELTELSPAEVWIGLKNSDDVGTYFDLQAEVFKNGTLIGSGEIDNVRGGSSGFNNAVLRAISIVLSGPDDVLFVSGDTLSIGLSARIGASGHRSGTARLWFNDAAANSSFDVTFGGTNTVVYLLDGFHLGTSPGTGPKKTIDVSVDRAKNGNPFKAFGIWRATY